MTKSMVVLFVSVCFWAGGVHAFPITYVSNLSGAAESPPIPSLGTGVVAVDYDPSVHTLDIDLSFSGLSGNTTAAHIHCCTLIPGDGTAGVATPVPSFPGFPAGVTSGVYMHLLDLTLASSFNPAFVVANGGTLAAAEATLAAGLSSGSAYLNIHTTYAPAGEIRGFLVSAAAPEPATVALLGLGIAGMGYRRRRTTAKASVDDAFF